VYICERGIDVAFFYHFGTVPAVWYFGTVPTVHKYMSAHFPGFVQTFQWNVAGLLLIHLVMRGVSEWLLFNANSAIFQLYHGENNLIFNEIMMRSALFYSNTFSWIPRFIEMSVQSQESERTCIYVLGVSILSLSTRSLLEFGTVPKVWSFFVLHFSTNFCPYYNEG
jgi:hypothetical protein